MAGVSGDHGAHVRRLSEVTNEAERIAVEIGAADGSMVEVVGALSEGERVIIRGAEHLEPGQKARLVT